MTAQMTTWSVKLSICIQWSGSRVLKEPGSLFPLMGSLHSLRSAVNHQLRLSILWNILLKDMQMMSLWYQFILQIIDLKAADLDLTLNHLNGFLLCFDGTKLFREVCHYLTAQSHLSKKGRPNCWGNWLMFLPVPQRKLRASKFWAILLTLQQLTHSQLEQSISYGFIETI